MIKTYRARSMQQALALVREELGPDAAVLHTRELSRGWFGKVFGRQQYEVSASSAVQVSSRHAVEQPASVPAEVERAADSPVPQAHLDIDYRQKFRADFRNQVQGQLDQLTNLVEELYQRTGTPGGDLPASLFDVFTDMIEAEVDEQIARELIDRVTRRREGDLDEAPLVKSRITSLIEGEVHVTGSIAAPRDTRRIVALVGPTGVGKTTTIAKLAANFRLREKRKVGLITVDTYRIAAVEQLRTYADIIDLPMEVVSTPREMREAVARLADLDLVLVDTAGRSPRDEVRIQELKSMLAEATADEVHLVLSSTSGARQLIATADRFAEVGATALLLTKLDEATGLGHLISLCRECRLPISYLTDGQNVPDDIRVAERRSLRGSHSECQPRPIETRITTEEVHECWQPWQGGRALRELDAARSELRRRAPFESSVVQLRRVTCGISSMSDQAQSLRNLVRRTGLWGGSGKSTVSIVSVCGARPGIGVSTLTALIAGGLRRRGCRVTLVESHRSTRQVADCCQLQVAGSLDDVVTGRRTVRETLIQGPAGIAMLPRRRGGDPPPTIEDHQVEDTLQALAHLGTQTDVVLIDAGVCPNPACQPWWQQADLTLLVTTPEPIAVMDGYAGLKQVASRRALPPLWTIVNQCLPPELPPAKKVINPTEVAGRIARACRRFLNAEPWQSFLIPFDDDVEQHAWEFTPPQPPDGELAAAIDGLVARFAAWLDAEKAQQAA